LGTGQAELSEPDPHRGNQLDAAPLPKPARFPWKPRSRPHFIALLYEKPPWVQLKSNDFYSGSYYFTSILESSVVSSGCASGRPFAMPSVDDVSFVHTRGPAESNYSRFTPEAGAKSDYVSDARCLPRRNLIPSGSAHCQRPASARACEL